ncbi:MAG: hypothetical protein U9N85_00895 [Bacteroidota bacterium]|nr:hypothetical protein [Bacteroidota bacterium]
MKNIILSLLFTIIATFGAKAQSVLEIYTEYPEEKTSWFMLYLDEESQDAFPTDSIQVEDLKVGTYELQLSFNSDTIADYQQTISIPANDTVRYKVVKMKEFGREARKMGRGFRRLFGKEDIHTKEVFTEVYTLKVVAEEE